MALTLQHDGLEANDLTDAEVLYHPYPKVPGYEDSTSIHTESFTWSQV